MARVRLIPLYPRNQMLVLVYNVEKLLCYQASLIAFRHLRIKETLQTLSRMPAGDLRRQVKLIAMQTLITKLNSELSGCIKISLNSTIYKINRSLPCKLSQNQAQVQPFHQILVLWLHPKHKKSKIYPNKIHLNCRKRLLLL